MFKVGDRVWCIKYGWGTVVEVERGCVYPVCVKFDNGARDAFTNEGLSDYEYGYRVLFFEEIIIPNSALERPRKTAEEMLSECQEVEFKSGFDNCYIYTKLLENEVFKGCYTYTLIHGLKYISEEDADKIVRECKENNRGEK